MESLLAKTTCKAAQHQSRKESPSGNHVSDAAGIESKLCGNYENLGSIVSWYICWCVKMLMGTVG